MISLLLILFTSTEPIYFYGEGSIASPEGKNWIITGLWELNCDGTARFQDSSIIVERLPSAGKILNMELFQESCLLPPGTCFNSQRIVDCTTGNVPSKAILKQLPPPEKIIVLVNDYPIIAQPTEDIKTDCCHDKAVEQKTFEQNPLFKNLPEKPSQCNTAPNLISESKKKVSTGDDALLVQDFEQAIAEYKAALTLDPCSGWAWAAIGSIASEKTDFQTANYALSLAVEFLPRHYTAWSKLGFAQEQLGQHIQAQNSYSTALSLFPGDPASIAGLQRLSDPQLLTNPPQNN